MIVHPPVYGAITFQKEIQESQLSHDKWMAVLPLLLADGLWDIEKRSVFFLIRMDPGSLQIANPLTSPLKSLRHASSR